jgi:hypothetical protein
VGEAQWGVWMDAYHSVDIDSAERCAISMTAIRPVVDVGMRVRDEEEILIPIGQRVRALPMKILLPFLRHNSTIRFLGHRE